MKLEPVDSTYGAPMGRRDWRGDADAPYQFRLFRVRLDEGGYDEGGAYWGHGEPLYCAYAAPVWDETIRMDCDEARMFMRVPSQHHAKAMVLEAYPRSSFL